MRVNSAGGFDWGQRELWRRLKQQPQLLHDAATVTGSELQIQRQLRQNYADELVPLAMSLVEQRRAATSKFSYAERMWLDRQGLQQSTSEIVARHKAQRFSGTVYDLCCGIGGDAVALAAHCEVVAVDRNPLACLWTKWNAEAARVRESLTAVCIAAEQIDTAGRLIHIDPDRRAARPSRSIRLEDAVPGLDYLQELTRQATGGAVKLSPAANFGGKFDGCEIELISVGGECKEATVWFGELAGTNSWRATLLPSGAEISGNHLEVFADQSGLKGFLYDPDPAVVRAGLLDHAAVELGLARLDEAEEYLTGPDYVQSPFVSAFEVLADLSNHDKEIRRYFRDNDFGQLEIKCRHIPIDATAVRRKLRLEGSEPGVLVFARVAGKARALVCRRLT